MRRGTIFIGLFVLVAAGIIAASQFIGSQPPLEVNVAVNPLVKPWLDEAVAAFNAGNPVVNGTRRVRVVLTTIDDLDVWLDNRPWTITNHPAAWIPAAGVSVTYAQEAGLPVQTAATSLARTPLVWGGFTSRVSILANSTTLDWGKVAEAAKAESWSALGGDASWQFVKLAFYQPSSRMAGLGALLSGAGAFNQTTQLTGNQVRGQQFRDWLLPVINSVNFNTLGSSPAATMAQRGASVAEIALLPEADWLLNLSALQRNDPIVLSYPAYQFVLDFPLARWEAPETTAEERATVDLLQSWLLDAARQKALANFGLRPANSEPTQADAKFAAGVSAGIQLNPVFGQVVQPPSRTEIEGLLDWVASN